MSVTARSSTAALEKIASCLPAMTIPALQSRGVVFMSCHNAIWEVTGKLLAKGVNPIGSRTRRSQPIANLRKLYA